MSVLNEHYWESVFPTLPDDPDRDPGPRIVSLIRTVDGLRQEIAGFREEHKFCDLSIDLNEWGEWGYQTLQMLFAELGIQHGDSFPEAVESARKELHGDLSAEVERLTEQLTTERIARLDVEIAYWHDTPGDNTSLHDHLGMSWKEYCDFTADPRGFVRQQIKEGR